MPALAADPRYPAGYQALPPPGYNRLPNSTGKSRGQHLCNDGERLFRTQLEQHPSHRPVLYTPQYRKPALSVLPPRRQLPIDAREQVDASSSLLPPYTPQYNNSGDGTVPLWSAAPGPIPASVFPGSHTGVFVVDAFQRRLFQILTGGTVTPNAFADKPVVVISLDKLVYGPGERILVLVIPDKPTRAFTGALRISRAGGDKFDKLEPIGPDIELRYAGAETTHLSMQLAAPDQPGAYRITPRRERLCHDAHDGWVVLRQPRGWPTPQPEIVRRPAPPRPKRGAVGWPRGRLAVAAAGCLPRQVFIPAIASRAASARPSSHFRAKHSSCSGHRLMASPRA